MKTIAFLLIFLHSNVFSQNKTPGFYTINIITNNIEFIDFEGNIKVLTKIDKPITSLYGNIVNYKNQLLMDFHDKIYSICINTGKTELIHDFAEQFDNKGASYLAVKGNEIYIHHEFTASKAGFLLKYNLEDRSLTKITANTCGDPSILAISFGDDGKLYGYSEAEDRLLLYNINTGNVERYIGKYNGIGNATAISQFDDKMWLFNSKSKGTDFHTVNLKTGETKFQFSKPDNYFGMAFLENECTPLVFKCEFGDYVSSIDQHDNYVLTGDAIYQDNDVVQITDDQFYRSGGIWIDENFSLNDGFETSFSFRFSGGNNYNYYDGSLPGADGLAFIIQSNEKIMSGGFGGNLGYSNIKNCIAMEIDTYNNFQYNEPNGNHFSILASRNDFINPNYNSSSHIKTNENIPIIYQDSIYYCKIRYDKINLTIYLSADENEDNFIMNINDFDISDYIDDNGYFNVGITSSTGNSVEAHNILSWDFCSLKADNLVSIEEDYVSKMVFPNPSSNFVYITRDVNNKNYQIFDMFGKEVLHGIIQTDRIDIQQLNKGIYFLKIDNNLKKIIKN